MTNLHCKTNQRYVKLKKINMNNDDKKQFLALIKGEDISEIMSLLTEYSNQYSRGLLRFLRWLSKWLPFSIMIMHMYGIFDFSRNPKEMFVVHEANWACYAFIYIMVYVLPIVLILMSRFFWLCWKYRIPFFYFFAVNSIHLVYWSWYTTNEMVMAHFAIMAFTLLLYIYGAIDWFCRKSKLGKRMFS